jgi:hypothetical protein
VIRTLFAVTALAFAASWFVPAAQANVIIVDEQQVDERLRDGESVSVTHDLSDVIPEVYEAEDGMLILVFTNGLRSDRAEVSLDGADSDTFRVGSFFDIEIFGLSARALASLNTDGLFTVTLTSLGGSLLGFVWESSTLIVRATAVPAPGALALLGAGLLGLALVRRRRAAA